MTKGLVAHDLRKTYGPRVAVDGVSLAVAPGELLGLLGPNGAGKSSTIAMLCGLLAPDGGSVVVGGLRPASDRPAFQRRIGLVPQEIALFEALSAQANVALFGALYGMGGAALRARAADVLAEVGLSDRAGDTVAAFSGGMKRRLNIACALVHNPDVLLLDEPTAGVDPQSRNAIFDTLEVLKRAGKALIYTTHYMEEVERLADRIVIVDHGRVVASGTLPELLARLPATQQLSLTLDGDADLAAIRALPGVHQADMRAGQLQVAVHELTLVVPALLQTLLRQGLRVQHMASGRATLEDVFLSLTGRQLRD